MTAGWWWDEWYPGPFIFFLQENEEEKKTFNLETLIILAILAQYPVVELRCFYQKTIGEDPTVVLYEYHGYLYV